MKTKDVIYTESYDYQYDGNGEMMFASHELEKRGIGSHQRTVIRNAFKYGFIMIHASNVGWMYE